jgi:hypothetical protein
MLGSDQTHNLIAVLLKRLGGSVDINSEEISIIASECRLRFTVDSEFHLAFMDCIDQTRIDAVLTAAGFDPATAPLSAIDRAKSMIREFEGFENQP